MPENPALKGVKDLIANDGRHASHRLYLVSR